MKILTYTLLIILLHLQSSLSCESNCCETSSCCQSSCQTTTCQSSCQSCCSTCQLRCRTQQCQNQCSQNCCKPDCCTPSPTNRPTITPTAPPPYIPPYTTPYTPPNPPPNPPPERTTVIEGSNVSNVNNDNMTTSIGINNTINNENHVNVPVSINNHNQQSIRIDMQTNTDELGPIISTDRPDDVTPTPPKIIVITERVPVPIPIPGPNIRVPVPVPYPVPYPIRIPQVIPQPGCCNVLTPCISNPCQGFSTICSQHCSSNFMFAPISPCHNGCFKRDYGIQWSCFNSGYCHSHLQNCYDCNENFYEDYNSYRRCRGCFLPQY